MFRRLSFLAFVLLMVASACSGSESAADNLVAVAREEPTVPVLAPTPPPTTEAVLIPADPLPTPITLSGGQGIVVTPTPEGGISEEPADDTDDGPTYNEAVGIPTPTYNEAVGIPTPTYNEAVGIPTPTPPPAQPTAPPAQPTTPPAQNQPTPAPQPTADTSNQVVNIANGGEVYTLNCTRCHGADGQGDLGYTGILGATAKYGGQAGLIAELTDGHPFTFGFRNTLSPQEIADVVAYVNATFG